MKGVIRSSFACSSPVGGMLFVVSGLIIIIIIIIITWQAGRHGVLMCCFPRNINRVCTERGHKHRP